MTICTFEDNEIFALIFKKKIGIEVENTIHNFVRGEDFLKSPIANVDLFVIDYELDGMNGMELFIKLKEIYPLAFFLILSNNSDPELENLFLEKGALAFLNKKFTDLDKIASIVQKIKSNHE